MQFFNVYQRFDVCIQTAKGVYVYDDNNQKYLDLYGGHGVISIGHSHPYYVEQIKQQLDRIGFYSNSIQIPMQEELALKLTTQSGYLDYQFFMCNSGAEANENAIKLASFYTQKRKVIAFKGSFHGRTAATLNVTDNRSISAPINNDNFPVEFIQLNNKRELRAALQEKDVCAVIIEGIQGVGGLDAPSVEYLTFLSEECCKNEALLIIDEIQSGFGRSGKFFAHQYANINPDIITMAKGMGNGFPVGGLLIHPKIKPTLGMLGTTFGGNYLACKASTAVLNILKEENIIENVKRINCYINSELDQLPKLKKIKGKGLMLGLEFDFLIKDLRIQLLNDYKIITGSSVNPNILRILPPLNITEYEIKSFISALKEILS